MKALVVFILMTLLMPCVFSAVVDERIEQELEEKDTVKVIVKLKDDPVEMKTGALSASGKKAKADVLEQKKEKIREKQERVLEKLDSKNLLKEKTSEKRKIKSASEKEEFFEIRNRYSTINGFSGKITRQALEELKDDADVASITISRPVKAFLDQSATQIDADKVWNLSAEGINLTGKGETICIIDTGIDYNHSALGKEFGNKVIGGYDYVNDDTDPYDDNGHGTHCAGIAASENITYRGIAPDSNLIAIKSLDSSGAGYNDDVIAGIDWCVANASKYNISVISMSLGDNSNYTDHCDDSVDPLWVNSINSAVSAGISVVAAAGNNGSVIGLSVPSCIENATPVSAVDGNDDMASFSQKGPILDLVAPGVNIHSTNLGGGFRDDSGTSMSTPHVAGAVALMKQFMRLYNNTDIAPRRIEKIFNETGKKIYDNETGRNYSRINIYEAIVSQDNIAPNITFISPTPENDSEYFNNTLFINASIDESLEVESCILEWNLTNESMKKTVQASSVFCYANKTKISEGTGTFTYKIYSNDSSGNLGISETRQVTLSNSMPNITSIRISSSDTFNRTNATLIGRFNYSDPEGDPIVYNETRWYNNSVEVDSFRNISYVGSGNTTKGQVWIFSARVNDGVKWSSWRNSSSITVANAAPDIAAVANITVNETDYVNISVYASDIDGDALNYSINFTGFSQTGNNFSWNTNLSDSGDHVFRINVSDGEDISHTFAYVSVLDLADFDGDGNPDYNDTDDDNDGINDSSDHLTGNSTDINSTIPLKLLVNNSENTSQIFNDTFPVNITDVNNSTLIYFEWNFTNSTLRINWTIDYNASQGKIKIKNIDLTSQSKTKTVYINKSDTSYNYVCIADEEAAPDLDSGCSGYTKVSCGSLGQCIDLGNRFKVSGLSHSSVRGIYYNPGDGGNTGGGGGGGSRVKEQCRDGIDNDADGLIDYPNDPGCSGFYDDDETDETCTENWYCGSWTACIDGIQSRVCSDYNACGTDVLKPAETRECEPEEEETEVIISEQDPEEENATLPAEEEEEKIPEKGYFEDSFGYVLAVIAGAVILAVVLVPKIINIRDLRHYPGKIKKYLDKIIKRK